MSGESKAVQALDEVSAILDRFDDDRQRLAILGTVALVLLRRVSRQHAVDWFDSLFASLD